MEIKLTCFSGSYGTNFSIFVQSYAVVYRRSRSTSLLLIFTPNIDLDLDYNSFDRLLFLISADLRQGEFTVKENLSFYFELSF